MMFNWLRSGDDFLDDWYSWLTNQCGHAMIGVVSTVVFSAMGVAWTALPLAISVVYFIVIEWWVQRLQLH